MGGGRHCVSLLVVTLGRRWSRLAPWVVSSSVVDVHVRVLLEGGKGRRYAHNHLLAAQERVANELARAQSHLGFRHTGVCRWVWESR